MTLVEIMIVVIVMALIASGVAYAVMPTMIDAQTRQTQTDMMAVHQLVSMYMVQNVGECPESLVDLNMSASTRNQDAWGNPFVFDCEPGLDPVVVSYGPDRQEGTDDDLRTDDHGHRD